MRSKKRLGLLFVLVMMVSVMAMTMSANAAVKLNKKKASVYTGGTVSLAVKGTTQKATWKSSNKKVAKVSNTGVVTGVKKGNATITAKVGGKNYKCKVTVKEPKKIEFTNKSDFAIYYPYSSENDGGETLDLKPYVSPVGTGLKWSSSNTGVAIVKDGIVTPISNGYTKITATLSSNSKKKATATVKVEGMGSDDGKKVIITRANFEKYFEKIEFSCVEIIESRWYDRTEDEFSEWETERTSFKTYSAYVIKNPNAFELGACEVNGGCLINSDEKKIKINLSNASYTEGETVKTFGISRNGFHTEFNPNAFKNEDKIYGNEISHDDYYDYEEWWVEVNNGEEMPIQRRTRIFSSNVAGKTLLVAYLAEQEIEHFGTKWDNPEGKIDILSNPSIYTAQGTLYYK